MFSVNPNFEILVKSRGFWGEIIHRFGRVWIIGIVIATLITILAEHYILKS